MKTKWTIGKKLIAAFSGVALITLAMGITGYFGAVKGEHHIGEIGMVRMPSVESLMVIERESEHISYLLQSLANAEASFERRQELYSALQESRETYEAAWNIYEPLPQTAEEESVWNQFVPAWNAWREANNGYIELNRGYDELGIQNPDELLSQVQSFRADLYALEKSVLELIVHDEDFTGGEDHTATPFGRWLGTFSSLNPDVERLRQEMQGANERFHAAVAPIRQAVRNGYQDEAVRIYTDRMDPAAAEIMERMYALIDVVAEAEALHEEAGDLLMETVLPVQYEAKDLVEELVEINRNVADAEVEQAHSDAVFIEFFSLVAMIVGVLLALGLGILITRSINSALKRIIDGLSEGADQVASASGQVSSASQSLAEGASEQAASIEETSSSLEEMSSMTKQNAGNAEQANSLMGEAKHVVGSANASMTEMVSSMQEIREASDETSKIIKTIDEIAFQTNLLALNAAVEAARAGEAGAGFAVVADEVRNLAMRAAEAAKNTSALIEGTTKKVQDGSSLVERTNEEFSKVEQSAMKVAELLSEIAAASKEQAEGIDQTNVAVADMDKVTQQNAANAEESASASEEMNAQAEQMKVMVDQLVTLVGGTANHHEGVQAGHSEAKRARKGLPRPDNAHDSHAGAVDRHSAPVAKHAGKEVNPQKAIPFDDDESFKDF